MPLAWIAVAIALAAIAGFAVSWLLLTRGVLRLQLGPVPIHAIEIPVEASVLLDGAIDVDVELPVEAVLTGRELGLERVTVPIDMAVQIDEAIQIDTVVPLDTSVSSVLGVSVPIKANLPIKTTVPIRHKVRVRESVEVSMADVRVPLRAIVPLRTKVPIREPIRVAGKVRLAEGLPVQLGSIRIRASNVKLSLE
jgi:hypothetical protein